MIKKHLLLCTCILLMTSCSTIKKPDVSVYGALFEMMHQGNLTTRIDLNSLENEKHVYGLGALTDLKGEILIIDSKPYISKEAVDGSIEISNSFNHEAALFVESKVEKWDSTQLPENINSISDLEGFLESIAEEHSLDIEQPFPFMIKGVIPSVDWHIINWPEGDSEHSHEKHINSGLSGSLKDTPVQILGFYSKHHQAIFTHHTTYIHMHLLTNDSNIAGHIDDIIFNGNQILHLPE
jgi:alpha-acetolactate decarboxylase